MLKEKLLATGYFIDNAYLDQYIEIVSTDFSNYTGYFEIHHILPKFYFQLVGTFVDNSISNLVSLPFFQHCKAHWLLFYCTTSEVQKSCGKAFSIMVGKVLKKSTNNLLQRELTAEEYEILQELKEYYTYNNNSEAQRLYSCEEIEWLKANYMNYSKRACAEILGRSTSSVKMQMKRLGLVKPLNNKEVINLETGEIFVSAAAAGEVYKISGSIIRRSCRDSYRTTCGYHWAFTSDPELEQKQQKYFGQSKRTIAESRQESLTKMLAAAHEKKKRKVKCIDTGEIFNSLKEAEASVGAPSGLCCYLRKHNPNLTFYGLHWEYVIYETDNNNYY